MSYRNPTLEVDTRLGDDFISSVKDNQQKIKDKASELSKLKNLKKLMKDYLPENKENNNKEADVEGPDVERPSMKSKINMAGTSMGSYDKPMMKGSYEKPMMKGGYDKPMMKAGCQISKHMGGRGAAMMGKKSCK